MTRFEYQYTCESCLDPIGRRDRRFSVIDWFVALLRVDGKTEARKMPERITVCAGCVGWYQEPIELDEADEPMMESAVA